MQVILLERIRKLGRMGEEVQVKNGFARNFLLPAGKALRANAANRKVFETQKAHLETRDLKHHGEAQDIATRLNDTQYPIIRQAGENGQLYGSVSARDIVQIVGAAGFSLNRQQVRLDKPIKEIGLHKISIFLYADVSAEIKINVARSKDEAARQARGENVRTAGGEPQEDDPTANAEAFFDDGVDPVETESFETEDTKDGKAAANPAHEDSPGQ